MRISNIYIMCDDDGFIQVIEVQVEDRDSLERKVMTVLEQHEAGLVIQVQKVNEESLAYLALMASREKSALQEHLEALVIS